MIMMSLLFNSRRELLGEVTTQKGALTQLTLTREGEQEIGARVQVWQTRGVPIRKEIRSATPDGKRSLVFYKEYIQPRSVKFLAALNMWGSDYGVTIIPLEEKWMSLWETLVRLPLEPQERFAFLVALRHTPDHLIPEWSKNLADAESIVRHDREAARKTIGTLQKRLSERLMSPFRDPPS